MSPFEENRPTFCQTEHVRRVLKYNFYPQTCINRGFVRHSREASFPMFFSARTHRAINCIPDFRSNRAIIVGNNEVLFSAVPLTSPRGPLSKSLVRQVARSEKLELRASERASDGADLSLSGRSIVFLHRFETPSIPGIERSETRLVTSSELG